ncbi:hypothetical protein AAULR_24706 [Lacticaseibacillus rhamnosus MTCC 5462]|nr:hypothetical protein AAULR_24706 [Lacticaseibacillus rhamnosus MTCC 5462]
MSGNDLFKKVSTRYSFVRDLVAGYLILRSLSLAKPLLTLVTIFALVVPMSLLGFLIFEYFKLNVARPTVLIFLIVVVLMFIVTLLWYLTL